MRSDLEGAPRSPETFFAASLFDGPWADPELPSWVAVDDDDAVIGFLAVHARRMRVGERPIRVACCSHLVVAERHRAGAAGAMLLRRCMGGSQDLTISDTAIEVVARLWRAFGGHVDITRSLEWMHVLHPGALGRRLVGRGLRRQTVNRDDLPVPGLPAHLAAGLVRRLRVEEDPEVSGAPIAPAEAAALLPDLLRGVRLRPDYDEAYLGWLLGRLGERGGEVVHRLVRRGGRPVGTYVYVVRPGGAGRVLQVAADARSADAVVGELLGDARRRGCTLLSGRFEPHLYEPLRRRKTAIGVGERHVVYSRAPDVLAALHGESALVTRLDGEWW